MPVMSIQQAFEIALRFHRSGRFAEAEHVYRQILAQEPNHPDALNLLGCIAHDRGDFPAAAELTGRAIAENPAVAEYHNNHGLALADLGKREAAIAAYRTALKLKPTDARCCINLGNVLRDHGQLDQAIESYQAALQLDPRLAEAHHEMGIALAFRGEAPAAIESYRKAIGMIPNAAAHSYLIQTLHYDPACSREAIFQETQRWHQLHAKQFEHSIAPHVNDRNPDRPLRIGYVSTDFFAHACAFYLLPLLANHDPKQFEIVCYAQPPWPDDVTDLFQSHAQAWRETARMSDDELAAQIRADKIDILVDLKVHTNGNRLLVFARKPAPVQVTWLGYPGTTGLGTVDYRITDPYLDPPGDPEAFYTEKSIRLPETFWCYDPREAGPAIPPPPVLNRGHITFGSMNILCKVNPEVLALWARAVQTVDGSRLMILTDRGSHRKRLLDILQSNGVDPERVDFEPRQPRPQYLELYNQIDIVLDSFPYNGETTTLDALWMGVPVVSLCGSSAVSRGGLSILSNAGLPDLVAHSKDEFAQIAANLARDVARLKELRSTLRQRLAHSPLMDGPRFARNMEQAYRAMWREWCARTP